MASYRGHLMLSAPLGAAYGALALLQPEWDWGPIFLGAGLCTIGGLLPDLDSDSGVPVRELFGITAAGVAAVAYFPLRRRLGLQPDQAVVIAGALYFLIRYVVANLFRRFTVHRGMFHSLPAMLIAGLVVFLGFHSEDVLLKLYLAGAVSLGFLSHLVLDEIFSVDFNGVAIRFNKFAGSAVKFMSPSWPATIFTYVILAGLCYCVFEGTPDLSRLKEFRPSWSGGQRTMSEIGSTETIRK